jgi:hypothetical protein
VVEPTVIAIDWSGAERTTLKSGIWLAAVQNGKVLRSQALANREEAVAVVCSFAPPIVVGIDMSFGAPAWFARERGCTTIADTWALAAQQGEGWLRAEPPFWRDRCAVPREQRFRACEVRLRAAGFPAKSIFQLVGNGQVGAGSVRGMPLLARLRASGFAIWPFDAPRERTVVEIYPSLLRTIDPRVEARAFASDHERDAVVSAEVMWEHRASVATLTAATDPVTMLEGDVWTPPGFL